MVQDALDDTTPRHIPRREMQVSSLRDVNDHLPTPIVYDRLTGQPELYLQPDRVCVGLLNHDDVAGIEVRAEAWDGSQGCR